MLTLIIVYLLCFENGTYVKSMRKKLFRRCHLHVLRYVNIIVQFIMKHPVFKDIWILLQYFSLHCKIIFRRFLFIGIQSLRISSNMYALINDYVFIKKNVFETEPVFCSILSHAQQ